MAPFEVHRYPCEMSSLFENMEIAKGGKYFRISSEMMLQHSMFDRNAIICLLQDVNRCTDNVSNSMDARRGVSQSLRECL